MTNFEHYKEEIKYKVINGGLNDFLAEHTYNGAITSSSITKWYLDEYVEPYKLTRFEKGVLENLYKSFKLIGKRDKNSIRVCENEHVVGSSLSCLFDIKFDCLEYDKDYKISDILANCEVID